MKIGYARVSSREQSENSHALEQQIERLQLAGAGQVLVDIESGWAATARPNLQKLLDMVESKAVTEVVVTRIDRLSRRGLQSFQIFDLFLRSGVVLRALDEPFDLTTAAGRAMAGQLTVFAQLHSDQKAESVKAGWKHLRSRGVAVNPPFGYRKEGDRHALDHVPFLCLIEGRTERSRAQIAREIVDAFLTARSLGGCLRIINERYGLRTFAHYRKKGGRVAREMFRFSRCGLRIWLTNPVLQGHVCYLRKRGTPEILHDRHEPIVTPTEAAEILDILKFNRIHRGYSGKMRNPLSGLVVCGECRSTCYSTTGCNNAHRVKYGEAKTYITYYQCKNWRQRACAQKRTIQAQKIEAEVISALVRRAEVIATQVALPLEQPEPLELQDLRNQLQSLKLLRSNPAIDRAIEDIQGQIVAWERSLQLTVEIQNDRAELLMVFENPEYWQSLTNDEKIQVFRDLIKEIIIKDGLIQDIILLV